MQALRFAEPIGAPGVFGDLAEAEAAGRRAELRRAAERWTLLRVAGDGLDRSRQPVRTLDALHLSSALVAQYSTSAGRLISSDVRVRRFAAG
jgi:hypothetical protein